MILLFVGISIGIFSSWLFGILKKRTQVQEVEEKKEEPFCVPKGVAEIYDLIHYCDPVDKWLLEEIRFKEWERYKLGKEVFLRSIKMRELPPEWAQALVGGFAVEFITSSKLMGVQAAEKAREILDHLRSYSC